MRPSQRVRQTVEVFIGLLLLASWARPADAERCDDCRFDTGFYEDLCYAQRLDARVKSAAERRRRTDDGIIYLEESIILAVWSSPPSVVDVSSPSREHLRFPAVGDSVVIDNSTHRQALESWNRHAELRERLGKLGAEARWQLERYEQPASASGAEPLRGENLALTVIPLSETPIGVDTLGVAARQAQGGFEACYERFLGSDRTIDSNVTVLFRMSSEGRVVEARTTRETQPAGLGSCLATRVEALCPRGTWNGGARSFLLRIRSSGVSSPVLENGAPVPRTSFVRHREPTGIYGPERPTHAVRRIISSRMGELRACYSRSLRRDSALGGYLILSFVIGGGGRVVSARVLEGSLPPEIGVCVADRIENLRFPPPEGGNVTQTLRLVFRSVP